jgi:hypothetical protein
MWGDVASDQDKPSYVEQINIGRLEYMDTLIDAVEYKIHKKKQLIEKRLEKDRPQHLKHSAKKYVMEYLRCKKSFEYFATHYILLELPGGDVLMDPYQKQLEFIDLVEHKKHVLLLKSRQTGFSTIVQAYTAWLCNFHDNVVVGIISKDGNEATDFARFIRGMIEKLPNFLKPKRGALGRGFAKKTERSFIMTNGSKVYVATVNPKAPNKTLRGKAITFLIVDEAAFIDYVDDAWTSIVPALSTNQMHAKKRGVPFGTVVISTPNKTVGPGKWYFNRYLRAISGEGLFIPFVVHWKMVDELADDPDWYRTQCELFDNDPKKIAQELELKFLPAAGAFFESETLEKVQDSVQKPLEKLKLFKGEAWSFQKPILNTHYIMGVDTAPEHGKDKSAITIWDYESMDQVWEYRGKLRVMDFIEVVKAAASLYDGTIVIESNSYGNQVIEHMNNSSYSSRLYKEKRGENTLVPGLSTTAKTRPLMIDALYSYVTQYPETVKSERLALELTSLVSKTNGRIEADSGCHDDVAISAALCYYVRKYDPPLLIGVGSSDSIQDLEDVLNMNLGGSPLTSRTIEEESSMDHINAVLLKKLKENIGSNENKEAYYNLFDMLDRG